MYVIMNVSMYFIYVLYLRTYVSKCLLVGGASAEAGNSSIVPF